MKDGSKGRSARRWAEGVVGAGMLAGLRIYRSAVSPFIGPHCRFYPSCSEYAVQAIGKYGPWRGAWLGLKRVSRCHPWNQGGYDPVP